MINNVLIMNWNKVFSLCKLKCCGLKLFMVKFSLFIVEIKCCYLFYNREFEIKIILILMMKVFKLIKNLVF